MTNLSIQAENLQASESRISDVDVATEMIEFVRNQVFTSRPWPCWSRPTLFPEYLPVCLKDRAFRRLPVGRGRVFLKCEKRSAKRSLESRGEAFGRMRGCARSTPHPPTKTPPRFREKAVSFAASEWAVLFVRFSGTIAENCIWDKKKAVRSRFMPWSRRVWETGQIGKAFQSCDSVFSPVMFWPESPLTRAAMSADRQTVVRGPNFMGWG